MFDSPSSTQRFLDKPNLLLIGSLTVWQGLDAYKTNDTLEAGGRETWPVARHFCGSREGRIGYGPTDTTHPHGAIFDVYAEDSPARVRADQEHYLVRVEDDEVWIELP